MAIRRKTALIVVGIAGILLLALIFVGPALIQVNRYRPEVVSYLQEKTGKQVEIGRLRLTFFPLSIQIDDFGVKNPPLFPSGYIVKVARIDAELSVRALLHRQVVIKLLVLEDPIMNLTSDPDGPWNFENPQATVSVSSLPLGVISRVQIKHGQLIASNLLPSDAAGPIFFQAREISGELEQVNLIGIINPSSSSKDGQGSLKAGLLRFGSVEVKNLEFKFQLEARRAFFTDAQAQVYGGSAAGDPSRVIDIDGYGVDVDGSGSVSVSGSDELNYRGLAEITTKEGFFTNAIARLSGAALVDGKLQFPFRIGGTIDNPVFSKGKGDKDVDAVQKPR